MIGALVARLQVLEAEADRVRLELAMARAPQALSIEKLLSEVAQEFGVEIRHLRSERRVRIYSEPRQAVMGLARELTLRSFGTIGRTLDRDRTTVVHGCRVHERQMAEIPITRPA